MRVYSAEGLRVFDPRTRAPIPADGVEVDEASLAFNRLLRAGDVTLEAPATAGLAVNPEEPVATVAEAPEATPEAPETGTGNDQGGFAL
jgi:hypothetical protein